MVLLLILISGCKADSGGLLEPCDETPPLAGSISPTCSSSDISLNQIISVNFSEEMEAESINENTFTVEDAAGNQVDGVVSYDITTNVATFTPASDFASNTLYTYTIVGGRDGVKDLFENALLTGFYCDFTTGDAPDLTAPTVIAVDPLAGSTEISVNKTISVNFSEILDASSITGSSFTLKHGSTAVFGAVSYSGTTAMFDPTDDLDPGTLYTATITTAAKDPSGNAVAADFVWTFTTATGVIPDTTPPLVMSTDPAADATGVLVGNAITALWNESMNGLSITDVSFTLSQGANAIGGTVSYAGLTSTFVPTVALLANTLYTATITTESMDVAGNALANNFAWSFTTESVVVVAPTVTSTDPSNNAIDVALDKTVTAMFSTSMDDLTLTDTSFLLSEGGNPVNGVVSYSGTTASFNPASDLMASTVYTATITSDAQDLSGTALANDFVWSFTTIAPVIVLAPVDLTCAEGFANLAGSSITSTGPTIINGDVGLSPGSAMVGFPPGIVNGVVHVNDTVAADAKICLTAAYNQAAGLAPGASVSGNIGGLTLTPGTYTSNSSLAVSSGNLTLDGQGDPNAAFVFQVASTFTMTSGLQVILAGGAQAKNVFWQIGTSATIGTNATMKGTIMADQSITLETGATLDGNALTRIAAITLDAATVNSQ